MSESTAQIDQKPGWRVALSRLFGSKKETGPSEEELKVAAFNHYANRLSLLKDSPLREDGQTIKDRVRGLVVDFVSEKKGNPSLTENVFVETKAEAQAKGGSLISIKSPGWNPEDSHLRSFSHDQPITKDRTWSLDRVVGDLLGEGFVDLDTRFKKSDSPFFGSDNASWEGRAEKPSVGVDRYNGTFSQ